MSVIARSVFQRQSNLLKRDCHGKKKASLAMTLAFLLLLFIPLSFATPPTSIALSYDQTKEALYVEAAHSSFNLEKSFVRLIVVYVNDSEVSRKNYFRQDDYEKFSDEIDVSAEAGDVIKVDVFCSLGGEMSKELMVKKDDPKGIFR